MLFPSLAYFHIKKHPMRNFERGEATKKSDNSEEEELSLTADTDSI